MKKRIFRLLLVLIVLFVAVYFLRHPIMRVWGTYLIVENELERVEYMFILSGAELERGNEAAILYKQGYADTIVCVGGNMNEAVKVLRLEFYESELTKLNLFNHGISDSVIKVLKKGTSTYQEAAAILVYCIENNIKKCIVLSSKFHTRRVKGVYKKAFRQQGIKVIIRGLFNKSKTLYIRANHARIIISAVNFIKKYNLED